MITLITEYLKSNRRLVVPGLGAFIRKSDSEQVLFSELLKRDDGVLRGLLTARGASELEADGAIDRLLFELRHTLEEGRIFQAPGLGVFARSETGAIRFRHIPTLGLSPEAVAEPAVEPVQEPKPVEEPQVVPSAPVEQPAEQPVEQPAEPQTEPTSEARKAEAARRIADLMRFKEEHPSGGQSSSQPRRPDPSLKGLKYGQPTKSTDSFTYVGSTPSRRPDTFILLAIAAVVIAVGAILYGYLKDRRQERLEREYVEQIVSGFAEDMPVEPENE